MKIPFTKMHGCGNDYIYINCFAQSIAAPESLSVSLSDRHKGVGGDGIVLMLPSSVADAKMRMFNLDGSEGKMCGNAIRCVGKYLYDNGIVRNQNIRIETISGVRELWLSVGNGGEVSSVRVDVGPAELQPDRIPVNLPGDNVIAKPVDIGGALYEITCVSMGNPHAVVFLEDMDQLDLPAIGPLFEHHSLFPEGVNTAFIRVADRNRLIMRVWERGSGETYACGTGACAAAAAAVLNGFCDKGTDVQVRLTGGELTIRYTEDAIYMTGEAVKVFDGVVEV